MIVSTRGLGWADGEVSPDGQYSWDGHQWQPIHQTGGTPVYVSPANPIYVDPGVENDPAIVMANVARQTAYQNAILAEQAAYNKQGCLNNGNGVDVCNMRFPGVMASGNFMVNGTTTVSQQIADSGGSTGAFSFIPTGYRVGDSWQIHISNAKPNSPIIVSGTKPEGSYSSSAGSTDGNGNWFTSGVFKSSEVGSWVENWFVGGVRVGGMSFSVIPVTAVVVPPVGSGQTQQQNPTVTSTNTTNTTVQQPNTPSNPNSIFSGQPTIDIPVVGQVGEYTALALVAAVGVGLFMMSRGR